MGFSFHRLMLLPLLVVLMLAALVTPPATAQNNGVDSAAVDAWVQGVMALYATPGTAIAIAKDGAVVYAQGYGVRNTETGAPVTAETQFSIGSLSKSLTALALMQAVDAGLLDLDAPLQTYLPDFTLTNSAAAAQLTLRHLLANRAGFVADDNEWYNGEIQTLPAVVAHIQTLDVPNAPGTTFEYNNLGFALAGYVLERVTGKTWQDIVAHNIFAPLGLADATTDLATIENSPNFASPHRLDVRAGHVPIAVFANLDAVAPAGAATMNAVELATYGAFQLGDGTWQGQPLVSATRLAEMHTEVGDGYALGWVTSDYEGYAMVWHNGSIDGYVALLTLIPSEGLAVATLANVGILEDALYIELLNYGIINLILGIATDDPAVTARQLGFDIEARQARFAQARAFTPDPATYELYAGDYNSPFVEAVRLEAHAGALIATFTDGGLTFSVELVEYAGGKFIGNGLGLQNNAFEITVAHDGTVRLRQDGVIIATRR